VNRTRTGAGKPEIWVGLILAATIIGTSCGGAKPVGSASATTSSAAPSQSAGPTTSPGPTESTGPTQSAGATQSAPLSAPKTSPAQDAQYFADVAQADSALASYIQTQGNVALQALLTDGSAFCAFLQRGGGIDNAMASVVIGARTLESQTHLPSTVTTFNTIDAVALLTLCPSDQKLIPASDQSKIRQLGDALATPSS